MAAVERASDLIYIPFDQELPSRVDGILIRPSSTSTEKGTIVALVEVKVRTTTMAQIRRWGSWLITKEKIDLCSEICQLLQIPLVGVLATLKDRKVRVVILTNKYGKVFESLPYERKQTQATVNGGIANRVNYMIPRDWLFHPRQLSSRLAECRILE